MVTNRLSRASRHYAILLYFVALFFSELRAGAQELYWHTPLSSEQLELVLTDIATATDESQALKKLAKLLNAPHTNPWFLRRCNALNALYRHYDLSALLQRVNLSAFRVLIALKYPGYKLVNKIHDEPNRVMKKIYRSLILSGVYETPQLMRIQVAHTRQELIFVRNAILFEKDFYPLDVFESEQVSREIDTISPKNLFTDFTPDQIFVIFTMLEPKQIDLNLPEWFAYLAHMGEAGFPYLQAISSAVNWQFVKAREMKAPHTGSARLERRFTAMRTSGTIGFASLPLLLNDLSIDLNFPIYLLSGITVFIAQRIYYVHREVSSRIKRMITLRHNIELLDESSDYLLPSCAEQWSRNYWELVR